VILLQVPGDLQFRGVVVRTVAAACRLARGVDALTASGSGVDVTALTRNKLDLSEVFDAQLVSAVSEAFNNIIIHAYKGRAPEPVRLELEIRPGQVVARLYDSGSSLSDLATEPDLDALPEGGLGLFIIRSFVDEFAYTPGAPNVWSMAKNVPGPEASGESGDAGG
jgi:serine/threonine-protein kinase RsbW